MILFLFEVKIRAVFYLTIIPGILSVMMILLVKEKKGDAKSKSKIDLHLRNFPLPYWKYLLVIALFGIGNSSNAFLILQTKDLGFSLESTILIYAAFNLIAALISYPAGNLSDKLGRKNILLASFLIYLITYTGFAAIKNLWLIAGLFGLYGLYQGIFRSVGKAMAADFVPQHLRASGIGWYATTLGFAGLIASIIAGQLWDKVGHTAVFIYGALFGLFGIVLLIMLIPGRNRKKEVT